MAYGPCPPAGRHGSTRSAAPLGGRRQPSPTVSFFQLARAVPTPSSGRDAVCKGSGGWQGLQTAPSPRDAAGCDPPPWPASCDGDHPADRPSRTLGTTALAAAAPGARNPSRSAASTTRGTLHWRGADAWACVSDTSRPASAQDTLRAGRAGAASPPWAITSTVPEKNKKPEPTTTRTLR